MEYILPIGLFAILGVVSGVLLTVASKIFAVKIDERLEAVQEALPQVNCGACGYSGCNDYAEAVVNKDAPCNMCKPGGDETSRKLADIMGKPAQEVQSDTAFVRCHGDCNVTNHKYDFDGIQSCVACDKFYSGSKTCTSGCLGYGDCVKICPENAISIVNRIAVIDQEKCVGCGLCAGECPNNLIVIRPKKQKIEVACHSADLGKLTRKICERGCIGCGLCARQCPTGAIKVVNNHAVIDYAICTNCGNCLNACKLNTIIEI